MTIERERDLAEIKAIAALARYKFQMFGYWAAIWVHLNKLSGTRKPNPFTSFVKMARVEAENVPSLKFGGDGKDGQ